MSTKTAVLATIGALVGALALGLALCFAFIDMAAPKAQRRVAMLGQGAALVCLIPVGAIWISWALNQRKLREHAAASGARPKKKHA